jgi:aspartate carbamoyltransferase catalytic subunit
LLDALTIQEQLGSLARKKVVICGDILHSRVARSNIKLLQRLGAEVILVAPPTLLPPHVIKTLAVSCTHCMDDALEGADVIMMLRLQRERMQSGFVPSVRDYFYGYGLTRARLNRAKPTAIVLHPGPLNRGVEIASDVADDQSQSRILNQVELGVAMRQAILALLLA